jgi:hypothetical protein
MTLGNSYAQNTSTSATPLFYDVAQETTVAGIVAQSLAKATPGMLPGAHIMLTSPSGTVDVSLGAFAFSGKKSLPQLGGQQIEVTGVAKTLRNRQVFIARLVKVGDSVYAVRNNHGLPLTPRSQERANQEAQNGESR